MLIYRCTNKINGKVYIGKTIKTLQERRLAHECNAIKLKGNALFYRALRKYGCENFDWSVVKKTTDERKLNTLEKFYIKKYSTKVPNGYNITPGGDGGVGSKSHKHDCDCGFCNAIKGLLVGKNNRMFGRHQSKKAKDKIRKAHLGIKKGPQSAEHREKRRLKLIGRIVSAESREKSRQKQLGRQKKHPEGCKCPFCQVKRGDIPYDKYFNCKKR
jgi:group I intron endonuclease